MPATNDDIMKKLNQMEQLLLKMSAEEEKIEADEEKELEEIEGSELNLEFPSIDDWRMYIWENCPFKKERQQKGEIDFFCKKQNGPCRFEGCPLNCKMGKK